MGSGYNFGSGGPFWNGMPMLGGHNLVFSTGKSFFVDSSTGSNNNSGLSPSKPFSTVDYAIGLCIANKGYVIYLMPGHAETVTATSIALDVAGITIVGLGHGLNRPTFTFGAAAATVTVSAANCSWYNCVCVANYANVAVGFTVSGKDFVLTDTLFTDGSSTLDWRTCVATGAVANCADGLTVVNCTKLGLASDALAFISILEATDRLYVANNCVTDVATGDVGHFIIMGAFVCAGARILSNALYVTGATTATVGVFMTGSSTTSTGIVADNVARSLDTASELFMTATLTFANFRNLYMSNTGSSGYLAPPIDVLGT